MRIRSVGHACLEIETKGLRIVTDPWWKGPAYTNQWYPWPTPQPAGLDRRAIDYLYLSHGHEDHLHVETLKTLDRHATVLVPEFLSGSMVDFLRNELGFSNVIELRHGETVTLRHGLKATCYINLTDSILVLEDGEQVLINANDALHASPPLVIDYFCKLLRRRHPSIDTLFLGFSGASWFPNCLRLPDKDDREVGRERERLFTSNFIRIVDQLSPRLACAFAASFVLLEPHHRWINEVKFEVPTPDRAYAQERPGGATRVHQLLPNDIVEGVDIVRGKTPRPSKAAFARALDTVLRAEREWHETTAPLSSEELQELLTLVNERVRANSGRLSGTEFSVELKLRGTPGTPIRIDVDAEGARASLGSPGAPSFALQLRPEILQAAVQQDYGIESIVIGYGAIAELPGQDSLEQLQGLLTLLSPRQGSWRGLLGELQRHPVRSLGALRSQLLPLALSAGARLGLVPHLYQRRNLGAGSTPRSREAA